MYLKYHQGVGVSVLPLLDGGALDSCTASTMQPPGTLLTFPSHRFPLSLFQSLNVHRNTLRSGVSVFFFCLYGLLPPPRLHQIPDRGGEMIVGGEIR